MNIYKHTIAVVSLLTGLLAFSSCNPDDNGGGSSVSIEDLTNYRWKESWTEVDEDEVDQVSASTFFGQNNIAVYREKRSIDNVDLGSWDAKNVSTLNYSISGNKVKIGSMTYTYNGKTLDPDDANAVGSMERVSISESEKAMVRSYDGTSGTTSIDNWLVGTWKSTSSYGSASYTNYLTLDAGSTGNNKGVNNKTNKSETQNIIAWGYDPSGKTLTLIYSKKSSASIPIESYVAGKSFNSGSVTYYKVDGGSSDEDDGSQVTLKDGYLYYQGIYYFYSPSDKYAAPQKTDENLPADVNIPSSLTYKGTTYTVTHIASSLFYKNTAITSVTLPNTITEIPYQAFMFCSNLSSISIPSSITIIGNSAFRWCEKLTSISIPSGVTEIKEGAFWGTGLVSVKLPNNITEIAYGLFSDCTSLQQISIPSSVSKICESAFGSCEKLQSITIPNSVTEIGGYAFSCSGLKSISIPNTVKSIGEYAFSGCESLGAVYLPSSLTNIEKGLFWGCSAMTNISIPNTVTNIGDIAFKECGKLTSINLPNTLTTIGVATFCDSGIKSIIIPNSVTKIGYNCFWACTNLSSVTLPNSLQEIQYNCFKECKSLPTITLPATVTKIGDSTFENCKILKTIKYNGTKSQWQSVNKGYLWSSGLPSGAVVSCTDGNVSLN